MLPIIIDADIISTIMAFEELTKMQSLAWDSAPFENVSDTASDIHDTLVKQLGVTKGEKWLDLATGTGAVAIRAAQLGANVTAQDFAPSLIKTAKKIAESKGLDITFDVGDCQKLPYNDASFDVISSAQGIVFAPDHHAVASELIRICKPGGRIGFTSWRPGGEVHEFLRLMASFSPKPPEGAGIPLAWGKPEYIEQMLGSNFALTFIEGDSPQYGESPEALCELFLTSFGPTKFLYERLDEQKRTELKEALTNYFIKFKQADGSVSAPREYLVTIGIRKES